MSAEELNRKATLAKYPSVCPKPYCNGRHFIRHEDGWQCLNCMKIIYRQPPLPYVGNNRPERVGSYKNLREAKEYGLSGEYLQSNYKSDYSMESMIPTDDDIWDWDTENEEAFEACGTSISLLVRYPISRNLPQFAADS